MNSRSTLVMVIIALVLLAVVYFGVIRGPAGNATATPFPTFPPPAPPLFAVQAESINGLRVSRPAEQKAFAVQRGADGLWRITEAATNTVALPAQADAAQVGNALQQLAALTPSRTLTEGLDLNAMGLVNPSTIITLSATSGITGTLATYELHVGIEPYKGGGYYTQKPGDAQVYLIASSTIELFTGFLTRVPLAPTPTATSTLTPTVVVAVTGTILPSVTAPAATETPAPSGTLAPTPTPPVAPTP
jgi:hypothetical protein